MVAQDGASTPTQWLLSDYARSVVFIADYQGYIDQHIDYGPYGAVVAILTHWALPPGFQTNQPAQTAFGYIGRQYDSSIGLTYDQHRYYDSINGRFLSPDPSGTSDDANLYRYSRNDPINRADYNGLDSILASGGEGGGSSLFGGDGGGGSLMGSGDGSDRIYSGNSGPSIFGGGGANFGGIYSGPSIDFGEPSLPDFASFDDNLYDTGSTFDLSSFDLYSSTYNDNSDFWLDDFGLNDSQMDPFSDVLIDSSGVTDQSLNFSSGVLSALDGMESSDSWGITDSLLGGSMESTTDSILGSQQTDVFDSVDAFDDDLLSIEPVRQFWSPDSYSSFALSSLTAVNPILSGGSPALSMDPYALAAPVPSAFSTTQPSMTVGDYNTLSETAILGPAGAALMNNLQADKENAIAGWILDQGGWFNVLNNNYLKPYGTVQKYLNGQAATPFPTAEQVDEHQEALAEAYNPGAVSTPTLAIRAGGVAQASFSLAGAIVTAPTALTGVGGAAFLSSLDNFQTGVRTAWTGSSASTLTSTAISGSLQYSGVDADTARTIGELSNAGISLGTNAYTMANLPELTATSSSRMSSISNVLANLDYSLGFSSPWMSTVVPDSGTAFGNAASNNYRATFFAENPELEGQVVVHHAVPQRTLTLYPNEVTDAQIHSLENLRGVPNEINSRLHLSQIAKEWNQFYDANPNATQSQLLQKASEIDVKYGSQFRPPVGGDNR